MLLRRGNRYRKTATHSQTFDRVAKGLYTAFKMKEAGPPGVRVSLAVPDSRLFRRYLESVTLGIEAAGIGVLLVGDEGRCGC